MSRPLYKYIKLYMLSDLLLLLYRFLFVVLSKLNCVNKNISRLKVSILSFIMSQTCIQIK